MQPTQWQYHEIVPPRMDRHSLKSLMKDYWQLPRHLIFSVRRARRVLVNGRYQPVNFTVNAYDHVKMTFLPSDFAHPFPQVKPDSTANVMILYEDSDLLVTNKRCGDKTHPNQPGEVGATINHLAAYLAPKKTVPYMIHRLDQQTSGAIIFAKNPVVVPILVANIREKQIKRTYLAWVQGTSLPTQGTISLPIGHDPKDKRKRQVNGQNSVPAVTHYQVITQKGNYSLLKIQLETGRTHQIRVHFKALGHPLVGDPLYNSGGASDFLLLHSWQVQLLLPFSKTVKTITAPLPKHFIDFQNQL